ncbi:MAG: GntR family transcriptional regulator [Paracoccaceae bacterium]|nr:MAG: GntR family transcriptional regulator [Paracoccaceae bacterium]
MDSQSPVADREDGDRGAAGGAGAAAGGDVAAIAEAIRQMRRAGGELPSERRLAAALQVKRHQLRKALSLLRARGELTPPRPRRNPQAGIPDLAALANPIEVIELRLMLEPAFARLASLRASGAEVARILEAATTPAGADAGAVDLAFHAAIAAAVRNNLAQAFYSMLRKVGTDARLRVAGRLRSQSCPSHIARRDAEHRRIAEAIAARDPDAAEAEMRRHLASVEALILERSAPGRTDAA